MPELNIWEGFDLSENKLKTAYDYLAPQAENFKLLTKSKLVMQIEVSRVVSDDDKKREIILYTLFIVAPSLGNFRKKILHVAEFIDQGRFPVNLYNFIDSSFVTDVTEDNLLDSVKEMLNKTVVMATVENLYRQSIEAGKNS